MSSNTLINVVCTKCGTNFELKEKDVKLLMYQYFSPYEKRLYYYANCPCCKKEQEVKKVCGK